MNPSIVCIGDVTNDAFIKLKEATVTEIENSPTLCMRWGEKIPYEEVTVVEAVGNSANAAVSIAKFGLPVKLVTWVGKDDFGQRCIDKLKRDYIETDLISIQPGKNTNYHYVLSYQVERTILVKHEDFEYSLPNIPENTDWIYFSSVGEAAEKLHDDVAEWIEKNQNTKLVFQPGTFQIKLGYDRLKNLYKVTHLFVCNKEEAQQILNTTEDSIKNLLKMMHEKGPKIVAITDGPQGAFVYDGSVTYFVPQYPDIAPPKERTGAGDAFTSTFMSFLANGSSIRDALLRAPINSMSVVQHIGAQKGLLSKKEIEMYVEKRPELYEVKTL